MKFSNKFTAAIAFVALMFGCSQSAGAYEKADMLISDRQIPIVIPFQRGEEEISKPQPGYDVTLLMNQTVRFAWDGKSTGKFVIKDDKGKIIFEKKISAGTNQFDIVPADAKLKAGQKYSWSVDADATIFTFAVLDAKSEKELLDNFAEIDADKNLSAEERVLKKATYVQLLSDKHSDTLDLYWLSAQWLSEISPTDEKLDAEKFYLLKKCNRHLLLEEGRRL